MKRAFAVTVVVGLFCFGLVVFVRQSVGQPATAWPATRCAVIDIVRVFNEFQQTKDLNEILRQRGEELKAESENRRKALEQKKAELEAFPPGGEDYVKRYRELMRKQVEFNAWLQMMQAEIQREFRIWTKKTYGQILDAVTQLATERGIDIVLYIDQPQIEADTAAGMQEQIRRRKVVWASKAVDITDMILERLNREYRRAGGKATIRLPF